MPNYRQPKSGETISGPLTMLGSDGSYLKMFDSEGVSREPQAPLVVYSKPPGVSAATPSNAQVLALCQAVADQLPEALMKQSVMLSRICLMPQQAPATGYSSLAATYNYTFGSTAVAVAPSNRFISSETVPVDLVNANPTLVSDLANRFGAQLATAADYNLINLALAGFTTNAAQGTAATPITGTVMAASIALLANTGEPIFLAVHPSAILAITTVTGLNSFTTPTGPYLYSGLEVTQGETATLANGASPSTSLLQGAWVLPCGQVHFTGGAPGTGTGHNLMFTPSAIAAVIEIETNINNTNTSPIANAIATGSFGNITVTVWALNTGSGVQTIYASMVLGFAVAINANGVLVKS